MVCKDTNLVYKCIRDQLQSISQSVIPFWWTATKRKKEREKGRKKVGGRAKWSYTKRGKCAILCSKSFHRAWNQSWPSERSTFLALMWLSASTSSSTLLYPLSLFHCPTASHISLAFSSGIFLRDDGTNMSPIAWTPWNNPIINLVTLMEFNGNHDIV